MYKQDPLNSHQTIVKRWAWIESRFHYNQLRRPIEAFILDRFKKNCIKATNGFQWVLSKMWNKEHAVNPSCEVKLNDIALEAARRATNITAKAGLSS